MFIKSSIIVISLVLLIGCNEVTEKATFSNLVNKEYTGDLAYSTTAYVEKYWRIAGNSGFDFSIYEVVRNLERLGYVSEENATEQNRLTYRVEKRPMKKPTWEPVDATVLIEGQEEPLLQFSSNRNMIAINSFSTPEGGTNAEVIYVKEVEDLGDLNVKGKIVFAEMHPYRLFKAAIVEGGAAGIMTYNMPDYLQPEKNKTSIQFRSIPLNEKIKPWCVALSFDAKERLKNKLNDGTVNLNVQIKTNIYEAEELTVVAEIKGAEKPNERLVFSAHVQEPGANDNASGVGVNLEIAAVAARLVQSGELSPERTLTFLWGDEIVSTRRYVSDDSLRARGIKWGISLDMVGENTEVTGGSFLIEKMPDPSAIWTRGKDKHTEWGASEMTLEDMRPHYLNDFVINRFLEQGKRANWKVNTNPYEGGSDHVPFLRANIPSVLFWHFTDQFYHTDNDRIDKVSKSTLKNVGTAALISAMTLLNADENTAKDIIEEVRTAGVARIKEELEQSKLAIQNGETVESQLTIIDAWEDWYLKAISSCVDMVDDDTLVIQAIESSKTLIAHKADNAKKRLQKQVSESEK